ncbi:MAG: efflux transporter outer membrane subunit [Pseudomonadota bacterium]
MARRALLLCGSLLLSACMIGPDPVAPELALPAAFQTTAAVAESESEGLWWRGFEDPVLEELVAAALARNLDLESALADLDAADALRRAERSDLFPILDGFVDSQLSTVRSDGTTETDTASRGGALLAFEPDLFGRQRRGLQAAQARYAAASLSVADLRRLVVRAVALRYIELRRSAARLALLDTALELQQRTLEIVESRYRAGLSPKLDVDRSAADLARTRARRGPLMESMRSAEYALAVLLGEAPRQGLVPASAGAAIPAFGSGPPIGVPAELVRRRPDVRAAEARFLAETALVGVELADLYPRLTLPGSLRADLNSSSAIADQATLNLTAVLDLPLLDGGRRRAEVAAQRANAAAVLAEYEQTVLTALEEVEAALVRIATLKDRQARLADSVNASRSAFEQLEALYREGLAGFIDVLDIQRTLIASQEAFLDSEADVASAIVALYAALGSVPDLS